MVRLCLVSLALWPQAAARGAGQSSRIVGDGLLGADDWTDMAASRRLPDLLRSRRRTLRSRDDAAVATRTPIADCGLGRRTRLGREVEARSRIRDGSRNARTRADAVADVSSVARFFCGTAASGALSGSRRYCREIRDRGRRVGRELTAAFERPIVQRTERLGQ